MDEMFKAMPGSPITYLTGDISAGQTTIAVADDTALPDAPNICTIGYGEHIETVRYGAKSNSVLQDVTRGIEGDPRAWPIGTEVARFFTAYDHNAIIQTINEHKAENVQDDVHSLKDRVISEYDNTSVSAGVYTKLGNGWIIAYRQVTINTSVTSHAFDTPIPMSNVSFAGINMRTSTGDASRVRAVTTAQVRVADNAWEVRIIDRLTSSVEETCMLVAIGRQ